MKKRIKPAILTLMPLSWNEIKSREDAEAKSFRDAFFKVFGVERRKIASFEEPIKKIRCFIDSLWRGQLLVEHKPMLHAWHFYLHLTKKSHRFCR